jgi:septum site-determining protein MinD
MGETIVFTSGKGGVGKTTTIANIGAGLSQLDKKVVMLDTDMGLRNLDVVMGLEDQINYNLLDLLENRCRLNQALIRDKRFQNLYIIPASLKNIPLEKYKTAFSVCRDNREPEVPMTALSKTVGRIR